MAQRSRWVTGHHAAIVGVPSAARNAAASVLVLAGSQERDRQSGDTADQRVVPVWASRRGLGAGDASRLETGARDSQGITADLCVGRLVAAGFATQFACRLRRASSMAGVSPAAVPVRVIAGNLINCLATWRAIGIYTCVQDARRAAAMGEDRTRLSESQPLMPRERKRLGDILTGSRWISCGATGSRHWRS